MIRGDDSRFTWDNIDSLVFNQCSKCDNKFPDKLGCVSYPKIIPSKYKQIENWENCEYFNGGLRSED